MFFQLSTLFMCTQEATLFPNTMARNFCKSNVTSEMND